MAILIGIQELSKSFSERNLFEKLSFSIASGERIGLIGPNGAGKSTLLSILAGKISPDSGSLSIQRGLRIAHLEQVPQFQPEATIYSAILEGAHDPNDWDEIALAQELMAKLNLTEFADANIETLSGGWKKRVALARELVKRPDLFLLDEPTNHLDVASILWLENFLSISSFATVTITHDRAFLQKVANRIIEINRQYPCGLLSSNGDYLSYLETKESLLAAQAGQEIKLRNTLRRETEWLRRGAKARTTKQQARIQRAEALSEQVEEISDRNFSEAARFDFQGFDRNPKKLLHAENISKSYGDKIIIPTMDLLLTPKSRVGLLGENGSGKSTFIRLLLRLEEPNSGSVFHSENLKISYFEQNRENLDPEISVLRTVCPVGNHVYFSGSQIHVRSYLERFLFHGNKIEMPVGKLSGGEQSRLLLALLMLKEANLLVLDEPTNDLDIVTLDLLQSVLQEFNGAVLLVTHDRYFLDQVANQIIGFTQNEAGEKELITFANLSQWETWQAHKKKGFPQKNISGKPVDKSAENQSKKRKLSFKEQRELDGMEASIEKAETRLKNLTEESAAPANATNSSKLLELTEEITTLENEIARLYSRWEELSALSK